MAFSIGTEITGILTAFKSAYNKGEVPLKTIVAALLLYGVKEFLNDVVFSCPRNSYETYGLLFIIGPTVLLFCLSLMMSESFWHLITGCGLLSCGRRRLIWSKVRNNIYIASMPPVIWLVYAFVEEDYYVCAKLGRLDEAQSKANGTAANEAIKQKFEQAKTESQVVAWGIILAFTMLATVFVTIHRIFVRVDTKLHGTITYDELEANKAVELFNAHIQPLAEGQAKKVVDEIFNQYQDEEPEEQIRLGEQYLKKLYPKHSGVVNGQVRTKKDNNIRRVELRAGDNGENIPLQEVST